MNFKVEHNAFTGDAKLVLNNGDIHCSFVLSKEQALRLADELIVRAANEAETKFRDRN